MESSLEISFVGGRNYKHRKSFSILEAEKDLIFQAQGGGSEAFGKLYDHYGPAIYRFIAIRVSSRQEAEDLTHEVFLSAWQKLPSYKEKGFPFSSWLYRIARNRVIDHYRTKKDQLSLDDPEKELSAKIADEAIVSIDVEMDKSLSIEEVKAVMKNLSQDQQDVIILRFVEDLEPREIAKILKKSEGSVRTIQFRAIEALKKLIAKDKRA